MDESSLGLGPDQSGAVLVTSGDRIAHVGTERDPRIDPRALAGEWLSCPECRIVPGAINAHTHIYSGLVPLGLPAPSPPPAGFVEILERVWWRLDRALDEPSLRAAARFYVAEALLAGTTTLIDHHESPSFIEGSLDVLADVCDEMGIRAVLGYGATERNGGPDEARRGLAECRRFIESNRRPLVRGVVGLHASFTVSDDTIRDAGNLCRELNTVLHVHLAEDVADVDDARRRGYDGPLERLLALDALPPGSIVAHGVRLDADQVRRAADAGIWIVQNPRSNRHNRVGYPRHLTVARRVALGTDGYPAQMAVEADALREIARTHGDDSRAVEGRIAAGHELAASLFGVSFAPPGPGAAADLVVLEHGQVQHVVVGGRPVVRRRRLATVDLDAILDEARREAPRLWERMAGVG